MRLARFRQDHGFARLGLVRDDGLVDLGACGIRYATMLEVISAGEPALEEIRQSTHGRSATHALTDVQLLAPIERPWKYLAIGLNYQKHVDESSTAAGKPPPQQLWFNKQVTCINDPFGEIDPGVTEKLDYEVELGVVIGRRAKCISADEAVDQIFGYFVVNDVSARDWQFHSPTFTMGKSFDTHGPIGPWITTKDEIDNPQDLELRCFVNGELRQSSNTSEMIYSIAEQIAYLSTAFTLEPGDLIATGTPDGVGMAMKPARFLRSGDVVRCEVERLGAIENRVR